MSTSMVPEQVDALRRLLDDTGGFAVDVADDKHRSLRVAVFITAAEDADLEDALCEARWFTISIAGTIREVAATPEGLAA